MLDLVRMHAVYRTSIVVALILLSRSMCLAQSNDVYSFFTSASPPLTGYRVAVVSVSPIWVVGSTQNRFGIEECSYWTDSAGRAIPWPASRVKQLGDKQHRYTRLRLGQVSISVPLSPIGLGFLTGFVALTFGFILITRLARCRSQTMMNRSRSNEGAPPNAGGTRLFRIGTSLAARVGELVRSARTYV